MPGALRRTSVALVHVPLKAWGGRGLLPRFSRKEMEAPTLNEVPEAWVAAWTVLDQKASQPLSAQSSILRAGLCLKYRPAGSVHRWGN